MQRHWSWGLWHGLRQLECEFSKHKVGDGILQKNQNLTRLQFSKTARSCQAYLQQWMTESLIGINRFLHLTTLTFFTAAVTVTAAVCPGIRKQKLQAKQTQTILPLSQRQKTRIFTFCFHKVDLYCWMDQGHLGPKEQCIWWKSQSPTATEGEREKILPVVQHRNGCGLWQSCLSWRLLGPKAQESWSNHSEGKCTLTRPLTNYLGHFLLIQL